MGIRWVISALLAATLLCSCATVETPDEPSAPVSREEAEAIAAKLAPQYGYEIDFMNEEVMRDVTPWDRLFPGLPFYRQPRYQDINAKLAGRHYWTIEWLPIAPRYGGSFCVFVDADTGEVIHVFTGW